MIAGQARVRICLGHDVAPFFLPKKTVVIQLTYFNLQVTSIFQAGIVALFQVHDGFDLKVSARFFYEEELWSFAKCLAELDQATFLFRISMNTVAVPTK